VKNTQKYKRVKMNVTKNCFSNLIPIYHINAFVRENQFSGNPAAVCPLNEFLPDEIMQAIAAQNNLAETAFIVLKESHCLIRWFAPKEEVTLCGHATLAAAHAIFNFISPTSNHIEFRSPLHILKASRENDLITLDFPARPYEKIELPKILKESITVTPKEVLASDDYLVVLKDQSHIENLVVDLNMLSKLDRRGVVFTAKGNQSDFVCRVFHPKLGIREDPVCGSAHCELTPYWSKILNKTQLNATQLSSRGGDLLCELKNNRVILKGKCRTYLDGMIDVVL